MTTLPSKHVGLTAISSTGPVARWHSDRGCYPLGIQEVLPVPSKRFKSATGLFEETPPQDVAVGTHIEHQGPTIAMQPNRQNGGVLLSFRLPCAAHSLCTLKGSFTTAPQRWARLGYSFRQALGFSPSVAQDCLPTSPAWGENWAPILTYVA